ncbi:MAG: MerR family transcriptional regulator [Turicibacter sp.]|nr:MerR family transcriptional regulator [Turicibacter sp.]
MTYTINKLAQLAGVSTRTLRYYDELGLLSPTRKSTNGYRIYGQKEIDQLQHILFYRELGLPLEEIKQIIKSEDFNINEALHAHLSALLAKRNQLDALITNVQKTISATKGDIKMTNKEKFVGFGQQLVDENEKKYGDEIRETYGNDAVEASNAKVKGMSKEQYAEVEALSAEVNEALKLAFEQGDPASELAQKACELHKQWLCYFWDSYTKEAHIGLAEMYVADERFTAYYDNIAEGCTKFLRDAILIYCK